MSIALVPEYFRNILTTQCGFTEWTDAFNIENIPSTILDESWHIDFGDTLKATTLGGNVQGVEVGIIIQLFFKSFRDTSEGRLEALVKGETVIGLVLDPTNRFTQQSDGNINYVFDAMRVRELALSNDNAVVLEIEFHADMVLCF